MFLNVDFLARYMLLDLCGFHNYANGEEPFEAAAEWEYRPLSVLQSHDAQECHFRQTPLPEIKSNIGLQ